MQPPDGSASYDTAIPGGGETVKISKAEHVIPLASIHKIG